MTKSMGAPNHLTVAEFLASPAAHKMSANQQRYAQAILEDVQHARETVNLANGEWSSAQIAGTLAALPTLVNQPHTYFVAVVPVLTAYFKARQQPNLAAVLAAVKAARPALVAKHDQVSAEQAAYEDVVDLVEQWVQAMVAQPEVANLAPADLENFVTVIHTTAELMITGKQLQPEAWTVNSLDEIMFGPFTHLLDEEERVPALFNLVPFALTTLFNYLGEQGRLPHQADLLAWVSDRHSALITMYDPQLEHFFEDLTVAMQAKGIAASDHAAVDAFTQEYLRAHPQVGQKLFSTDQQLGKTKHPHQLKYSQKRRKKRHKR
ncbi:hypothetical protein FD13_GL001726 [Levilactobacillus senmaizukei DSM 21775 = NBRC 103853]|uniref:Uncharacterized protein n=1 Tax=Levilactobacillus senmaizukei DSM 21775 = NBRC 103853 TaxID=1423803 RepID=A0A0R2DR02_9LACO|nr:hypothetical protein [Levilactobacillus senmaizukei]KRN02730.1 hypothetical protein FD13_GL001726 [Levilactobacillus senmaizukei DSM 21775 = NBRC 103853]